MRVACVTSQADWFRNTDRRRAQRSCLLSTRTRTVRSWSSVARRKYTGNSHNNSNSSTITTTTSRSVDLTSLQQYASTSNVIIIISSPPPRSDHQTVGSGSMLSKSPLLFFFFFFPFPVYPISFSFTFFVIFSEEVVPLNFLFLCFDALKSSTTRERERRGERIFGQPHLQGRSRGRPLSLITQTLPFSFVSLERAHMETEGANGEHL